MTKNVIPQKLPKPKRMSETPSQEMPKPKRMSDVPSQKMPKPDLDKIMGKGRKK
jgi:hypothetical protein